MNNIDPQAWLTGQSTAAISVTGVTWSPRNRATTGETHGADAGC